MRTLYETISNLCATNGVKPGRLCSDLGFSRSTMSDLKMGRKKTLSADYLAKISEYFSVSIEYLLGAEQKEAPAPTEEDERKVTDSDIKFALFGNAEISDDVLEEVKRFAKFALEQKEKQ